MMKIKNILFGIFVVVEAVLYALILSPLPNSYIYSFTAIALTFVMSIILFYKSKNWLIVFLALLFTLIADTFLVLLHGEHKVIAMISFNFTQILYAVKLALSSGKKLNITSLVLRIALTIITELVAFVILKIKFDSLIFVTLPYFVNLVLNAIFAFTTKPINWLFAVGMILFVLCDINVGLPFLTDIFSISEASALYKFLHLDFNFVWLFYLPSQVLILSSLFTEHRKAKKKI